MGFNSTVVVMNDALHDIEGDKDFEANLAAILQVGGRGGEVDVRAGSYCNAATVIETHHADSTSKKGD